MNQEAKFTYSFDFSDFVGRDAYRKRYDYGKFIIEQIENFGPPLPYIADWNEIDRTLIVKFTDSTNSVQDLNTMFNLFSELFPEQGSERITDYYYEGFDWPPYTNEHYKSFRGHGIDEDLEGGSKRCPNGSRKKHGRCEKY